MKINSICSLVLLFLVLLVGGCAETKSATRVAGIGVVRVKTPLLVVSIDGQRGNMSGKFKKINGPEINYYSSSLIFSYYDIKLQPGTHVLEIANIDEKADGMLSQTKKLNVEPGCIYEAGFIKDAPTEAGIPILMPRLHYQWTLVIEEVK